MAYRDAVEGRRKDRERFARRTAHRIAEGKCPRCGERPPAPKHSVCRSCAEKRNAASRARDARLRAEGKPRRDPAKARAYERQRARRQADERRAAGMCVRCGTARAAEGRKSCESCLEKRRALDRAKYAVGKAAGLKYGGDNIEAKRRAGRARSRKRQKARTEAGLCIRCGKQQPVEGGTTCAPCRESARRRRSANTTGGAPTAAARDAAAPSMTACRAVRHVRSPTAPAGIRNARTRVPESTTESGASAACVHPAGRPPRGPAAAPLARKDRITARPTSRASRSGDPTWTVVELESGREHGPFDSEADVALCLAFEKLDRGRVEVVCDASPMARFTAWS